MDTLKTAIVVMLLLAVLYGVYVVLNQGPQTPLPDEIAWHQDHAEAPSIEFGGPDDGVEVPPPLEATTEPPPALPPNDEIEGSNGQEASLDASDPPTAVSAPDLLGGSEATVNPSPDQRGFVATVSDLNHGATAPTRTPAGDTPQRWTTPSGTPEQTGSVYAATPQADAAGDSHNNAAPDAPSSPATNASYGPPPTDPLSGSPAAPEQPGSQNRLESEFQTSTGTNPAWNSLPTPEDVSAGQPSASALQTPSPTREPSSGTRPAPSNGYGSDTASAATASADSAATDTAEPPTAPSPIANAFESASQQIEQEQWHDALWTLSLFYDSPDVTPEEHRQLLEWLDLLAAKVVYSNEHLIEKPFVVRNGDTLPAIARQYQVPWQFLANINGLNDPNDLVPGTPIKVVRGPFRGELDLSQNELTLFVGKLYAGRFPVEVGSQPTPAPGEYEVLRKAPGKTYSTAEGSRIPAEHPANPYGGVWFDLGGNVVIHGMPSNPRPGSPVCIGVEPNHAHDLYAILSAGSPIVIRR